MNRAEVIQSAGEIVENNTVHRAGETANPVCVLALLDARGNPTASTITPAKADGIREIFFCTGLRSNKAVRIARAGRAGVCFNAGGSCNITLVGAIEVVTDPEVLDAMWYAGMGQHFSGPRDPAFCVLRFSTERYNLFVPGMEAELEGVLAR